MKRELARLRRENELLRSQLGRNTPLPRSYRRQVTTPPETLVPHAVIADRYELERVLAHGGMGSVWVAADTHTGQQVALKFLKQDAGPAHIARFQREAEVCRRLSSDHVVKVLDHGVDGAHHFLAMELLVGESLSSLLRRRGRLPLGEAQSLARDIADALAPAHAAGVVHRDLKPQNLFLSVGERGERVLKLLDFGVAKELEDFGEMTNSGEIIGSPNYMSPEQAYGLSNIDHRSDLWAVAVILYRTITGSRPWEGDNALELLLKICTEPAPAPSRYEPALSARVDAFFDKALARDPNERFRSIHELCDAFEAAAASTSRRPAVASMVHGPTPSSRGSILPLTDDGDDPDSHVRSRPAAAAPRAWSRGTAALALVALVAAAIAWLLVL